MPLYPTPSSHNQQLLQKTLHDSSSASFNKDDSFNIELGQEGPLQMGEPTNPTHLVPHPPNHPIHNEGSFGVFGFAPQMQQPSTGYDVGSNSRNTRVFPDDSSGDDV